MYIIVTNFKTDNSIAFETEDTPRARALFAYIEEITKKAPQIKAIFVPDITSQEGNIPPHTKIIPSEIQFIQEIYLEKPLIFLT